MIYTYIHIYIYVSFDIINVCIYVDVFMCDKLMAFACDTFWR